MTGSITDPITDIDFLGYVDDQLDVARRIEVEHYLARHPDAAARVMADLKDRDLLRLALGGAGGRPPEPMMEAARRLGRSLALREFGQRLRRIAAVAALVGLGWLAHAQIGLFGITDSEASPKPPAFVEDALHAHKTALLRARMVSQREAAAYDPAEILVETGIRMPDLPADWRIIDTQVFPSRDGHSVEMTVEAGALGRASLFAAQVAAFDVIPPTLARFDDTRAVYWQSGQRVYALTGTAGERVLERSAHALARKLQ